MAAIRNARARRTDMHPTQRPDTLPRLACAACAVMATAAIGLFTHALARNYDVAAAQQAMAQPVLVAHAQSR
jgi:hypothetical protein